MPRYQDDRPRRGRPRIHPAIEKPEPKPIRCANPKCRRGQEGARKLFNPAKPWGRFCCDPCRKKVNEVKRGFGELLERMPKFRKLLTEHLEGEVRKRVEGELGGLKSRLEVLEKEVARWK